MKALVEGSLTVLVPCLLTRSFYRYSLLICYKLESVAFFRVFCILWAEYWSNDKGVLTNLVDLNEAYSFVIVRKFPFLEISFLGTYKSYESPHLGLSNSTCLLIRSFYRYSLLIYYKLESITFFRVFCILWANYWSNDKSVLTNLVDLNETYSLVTVGKIFHI